MISSHLKAGSFEALARLRMKSLGPVSPIEFIPIAEKTKLIIPIGEKVMISTLRFLQRLAEQGIDDIVISVNISAIELLQPELDRAITGDIISMAHRLGHCAVAEGVEVEAQKQYLIAHGCDRMQGFLFSKALDEEAALALLKRHR